MSNAIHHRRSSVISGKVSMGHVKRLESIADESFKSNNNVEDQTNVDIEVARL